MYFWSVSLVDQLSCKFLIFLVYQFFLVNQKLFSHVFGQPKKKLVDQKNEKLTRHLVDQRHWPKVWQVEKLTLKKLKLRDHLKNILRTFATLQPLKINVFYSTKTRWSRFQKCRSAEVQKSGREFQNGLDLFCFLTFWMVIDLNICYCILQAGIVEKNQIKDSKFEIWYVQIDELPRSSVQLWLV